MILTENKKTIHFKQKLLPNCLSHDLEIVTVNVGESTSQYHTQLAVAKLTGKKKKITSGYFIATPRIITQIHLVSKLNTRGAIPPLPQYLHGVGLDDSACL